MKYFSLIMVLALVIGKHGFSQELTNTDPSKNYVNVNIQKTPESAAFEKYGITQVNEFTGTSNISIPIYTLSSRFMQVPITLSYSASGIKVNQEASWVGLGFDLIVGGRITVETRGSVDFNSSSVGLTTPNLQSAMTEIFTRLGIAGENAVFTPASFWEPPGPSNPLMYNGLGIEEMVLFGTGEPDIFRANFAGHSLAFYVDKVSNQLKFLGQKSNFQVTYTLDASHNITGWKIVDEDGISYYFNQIETTTNTIPSNAIVPATTASAWLLTKMVHPSGDTIIFTYANYGYTVPAFTMAGSIKIPATGPSQLESETFQNINVQSPYYLTRVESSNVAVDFLLETRTDLYGPGSRRLTQINVVDKVTNTTKKTATFHYGYFQATAHAGIHNYLNSLIYQLPSTLSTTAYIGSSTSRLRLDSVNIDGPTGQPPYRFYYNSEVPDKYSYSQDHWGYYNGISNTNGSYNFTNLIPLTGFKGVQYSVPSGGFTTSWLGHSRDADPIHCQAMILESIVYPTGGSSSFEYELHQSEMVTTTPITGGGLRIKSVKNYDGTGLVGSTEYSYLNGKYMGTINYLTDASVIGKCNGDPSDAYYRYSTNGAINFNDIQVGYQKITVVQKDKDGLSNGSMVKTFNINSPSSNYSTGLGYYLQPPYYYPGESPMDPLSQSTFVEFLDPWGKNFPPTPASKLEGKLAQEEYLDNYGNPVKSIIYYYSLGEYTKDYYSIKAIQNRVGGFEAGCIPNIGYYGWRPVNLFVSPAKSFWVLTDSVVEKTYQGSNTIVQKKSFTYDTKFHVRTESYYNSDNSVTTVSYTRPYDYISTGINGNTTIVYMMTGKNINNPVFSITTRKDGVLIDSLFNLYHEPSTGIYVPQNTQVQLLTNPIETRQLYNTYDSYGHLLERQKPGGAKEIYLWGYSKKFPVAFVVGSDYATISGIIDMNILDNPASDASLISELNKLRTQLPGALVTTYTYDRVYGITSETDPAGRTTYYEYDGLGRLYMIRDQDNNVIKTICYNYAGQVENCTIWGNQQMSQTFTRVNSSCATDFAGTTGTYSVAANKYFSTISQADANSKAQADIDLNGQDYVNTNAASGATCIPMVKSTNTTSMPFTLSMTNTATSVVSSFSAYPSASPTQIGQVPIGNYNIQLTPYSSYTAQVTFNGTNQTSSSFSYNNVAVNGPVSFSIAPAPVSNCTISMQYGYTSPTKGISKTGSTVTFYLTFYSSSAMLAGSSYYVATINGDCRPTSNRTISFSSAGRNWTITIYTSGMMILQLNGGSSTVNPNTTISTGSLNYNL